MIGLLILILGGAAAIIWWRLLHGKERARQAASSVCKTHGLVLMDDTVMLQSIRVLPRDPARAWGLKYTFEFAYRGIPRKGGTVLIAPGRHSTVIIETDNGPLIEQA